MGVADLRTPFYGVPKTDTSWLGKLVSTAGDAIDNKVAGDLIQKSLSQGQIQAGVAPGSPSVPTTAQQPTGAAPVTPVTRGAPQGSTYRPFIDTVQKGGLTNPYGLSAVAAYGKAESSWSGDKANATWADPSESGQAGTSGGVMSWRGPRLASLQGYAKSKGEQGNGSPQTQAEFFLQENPQVTQALNNAKSPQEANSILANAWKFAGYDRPGGENGRRAAMAQNYYAQEFSKMPNTGAAAIEAVAPQGGFDSGRFAPTNGVAQDDLGMRQGLYRQTNEMQSAPYVDPEVSAQPQVAPAPLPYNQETPTNSPAPVSPQAAQTSNQLIAAGAVPLNRQNTDPDLIRRMVQNPVTRALGLQMAQQVLGGGKAQEPWQFSNLPDGTLIRANQQTGAVERVGNFAKPDNDTAVVGNDLIRKSDGSVVYSGTEKDPKIVELFDEATGQPYKAQYNPKTQTYDRVGGVKARTGMTLTTNADGTVSLTQGAIGNMPKLTEAEGKNTGFYGRTIESNKIISELEKEGTSLWNRSADNIPIFGNALKGADAQRYTQAKRDFVNAVLRRESGAVISPEEFANAEQQYFPQYGDKPENIAQKRRNRETTMQGLKVSSGQGAAFATPPAQQSQPGTRNKTSSGIEWSVEP